MKTIKDLEHFEKIVERSKYNGKKLCFHFDGTSRIYIYDHDNTNDETTIEFDYVWDYFDMMTEIFTKKYNLIPNLL